MKDYEKIKNLINEADAILLGVEDDIESDLSKESFKEKFPELVDNYGMTDIYTSSFYDFKTEDERWSYWSKYIDYFCNKEVKESYKKLFRLLKDKNYFVITTKTDKSLIKAGFDKNRVFEVQGDLTKIQCAVGCHNELYDDTKIVDEMIKYKNDIKVPKNLIPYCPICEGRMEINLRKDAFFVEDDNWKNLNKTYSIFVNENKDKKLLLIELSSSLNNPSIIRFPFEKMTYDFKNTNLIRISKNYSDVPFEIKLKSVTIKDDYEKVLNDLFKD